MQKFKCHKVVEAGKITRVVDYGVAAGGQLEMDTPEGTYLLAVNTGYLHKHQPGVGGYFVRYADGYESYSPAAAFEAGYTAIGDAAPAADLQITIAQLGEDPILKYFAFTHLPERLQAVSRPFVELAVNVILRQTRSAERTVALRKLLECKDATVRAALDESK